VRCKRSVPDISRFSSSFPRRYPINFLDSTRVIHATDARACAAWPPDRFIQRYVHMPTGLELKHLCRTRPEYTMAIRFDAR